MFRKRRIVLQPHLLARAERHAQALGYSSVEEFVTHLLETHLDKLERSSTDDDIRKRLKGLGYLA